MQTKSLMWCKFCTLKIKIDQAFVVTLSRHHLCLVFFYQNFIIFIYLIHLKILEMHIVATQLHRTDVECPYQFRCLHEDFSYRNRTRSIQGNCKFHEGIHLFQLTRRESYHRQIQRVWFYRPAQMRQLLLRYYGLRKCVNNVQRHCPIF